MCTSNFNGKDNNMKETDGTTERKRNQRPCLFYFVGPVSDFFHFVQQRPFRLLWSVFFGILFSSLMTIKGFFACDIFFCHASQRGSCCIIRFDALDHSEGILLCFMAKTKTAKSKQKKEKVTNFRRTKKKQPVGRK